MRNTTFSNRILKMAVLAIALVSFGFAQMNGSGRGGMTGSGSKAPGMPGIGPGPGSTMPGGISGMGTGMGSMYSGPVVGPDGTAYVLRETTVTAAGQQSVKTELLAINPSNGKINWSLPIDGSMISEPVLAKDGTILLTTSEPAIASSATAIKPALLIVAPTATSARVQARVPIDSDLLSAPVSTPDGQTIYVSATDMPSMMTGQTTTSATTFLYAFVPGSGSLKFKVQLR